MQGNRLKHGPQRFGGARSSLLHRHELVSRRKVHVAKGPEMSFQIEESENNSRTLKYLFKVETPSVRKPLSTRNFSYWYQLILYVRSPLLQ